MPVGIGLVSAKAARSPASAGLLRWYQAMPSSMRAVRLEIPAGATTGVSYHSSSLVRSTRSDMKVREGAGSSCKSSSSRRWDGPTLLQANDQLDKVGKGADAVIRAIEAAILDGKVLQLQVQRREVLDPTNIMVRVQTQFDQICEGLERGPKVNLVCSPHDTH